MTRSNESSLQLLCPAKVNLALSVGGPVTVQGGLHPIASWMIALTFGDDLTLTKAAQTSRYDIAFEDATTGQVDWPLEKDLAVRAHHLLEARVGRALPVDLQIAKRIPAGAGLGGGSSNAAAVLVGLNRLYQLNLDRQVLVELGLQLGSDVAFLVHAIQGDTSAIVSGYGERIDAAKLAQVVHLVLIFPPFGCPTGPVYQAFDQLAEPGKGMPDLALIQAMSQATWLSQDAPINDLAAAACRVRPELATLREQVAKAVGIPVHITGSGSTMFLIAPSAITAQPLARKVESLCGLPAAATRSL